MTVAVVVVMTMTIMTMIIRYFYNICR